MSKFMRTLCVTMTAVCALTACQKSPEEIERELTQVREHAALVSKLVTVSEEECETAPTIQLKSAIADMSTNSLRVLAENKVTICADQRMDTQQGPAKEVYGAYYNTTAKKIASINSDKDGKIYYADSILSKLPDVVTNKKDGENAYAGRFTTRERDYNIFLNKRVWRRETNTKWASESPFVSTLKSNPDLKTPPLKPAVKANMPQW